MLDNVFKQIVQGAALIPNEHAHRVPHDMLSAPGLSEFGVEALAGFGPVLPG